MGHLKMEQRLVEFALVMPQDVINVHSVDATGKGGIIGEGTAELAHEVVDMDAPNVSNFNMQHLRMWIQNKIRENDETAALVVAQAEDSEDMIAHNLATHGIASYGNAIVFDDYKKTELYDILAYLLNNEYNIGIEPEAKTVIQKYIDNIKASDTKASPVNARTMQHLSQTIAHITQLRLAQSDGERMVTAQDVAHFKWDKNVRGKVGFA